MLCPIGAWKAGSCPEPTGGHFWPRWSCPHVASIPPGIRVRSFLPAQLWSHNTSRNTREVTADGHRTGVQIPQAPIRSVQAWSCHWELPLWNAKALTRFPREKCAASPLLTVIRLVLKNYAEIDDSFSLFIKSSRLKKGYND